MKFQPLTIQFWFSIKTYGMSLYAIPFVPIQTSSSRSLTKPNTRLSYLLYVLMSSRCYSSNRMSNSQAQ